jgi:protein-glutamine gamma-glutamyltransferase
MRGLPIPGGAGAGEREGRVSAAAGMAAPRAAMGALRAPGALEGPLRIVVFASFAAYVVSAWLGMIIDPPIGRAAAVLAVMVAAAAILTLLGDRRMPTPLRHLVAGAVSLLAMTTGAIALGLSAHLVLPWNWGELATDVRTGLAGLWSVNYPYTGSVGWTRLVLLLGIPLMLGVAVGVAFWPAHWARAARRTLALIVLVIAYVVATAAAPPSAPLLNGLWLLLGAWAWLWLPGHGLRRGLLGAALVLATGLLALPIAAALDVHRPWIDYRHWGRSHAVGPTESFTWDQSYGPLTWPRVGRSMLHVQSDAPYYWRAAVLDEFDGTSWVQSQSTGDAALQLPAAPSPPLNPDWIHRLTFTIDRLRSDLVVAAGTPLSTPHVDGLAVMERGLVVPSDTTLGEGDSYEIRSYIPEPTAAEMRHAPEVYPSAVARDTAISLPAGRTIRVPFWGAQARGATDRALAGSAYGNVYDLARRITAGHSTEYGAVKAIENYLGEHYDYSEFAPIDRLGLRTFLLDVHRGYCQHFSGAMALMLRMLGIPARVAAGFSPGRARPDSSYVVTDLDSHSWVEVYFNGIGWVTFDPTPPAAPAQSRTSGLGAPISGALSQEPDSQDRRRKTNGSFHSGSHPGAAAAGAPLSVPAPEIWIAVSAALVAAGAVAALRRRVRGRGDDRDAQLREVAAALARVRAWDLRGATLLALERRLEAEAGPEAAAYLARLRSMRYHPEDPQPPGPRERRALRRQIAAGRGARGRIRALTTIPPWGAAAKACKPPFRSAS